MSGVVTNPHLFPLLFFIKNEISKCIRFGYFPVWWGPCLGKWVEKTKCSQILFLLAGSRRNLECVILVFSSFQGSFVACMIAVLQQMDDAHYSHYISTFKTVQDITVSLLCVTLTTFLLYRKIMLKNMSKTGPSYIQGSLPHLVSCAYAEELT